MTWVNIALALVKLANLIFENWRDSALEQAGENKQALKSLQAMQAISMALKEVDARFEKMSDAEIKEEITKQGDWRAD